MAEQLSLSETGVEKNIKKLTKKSKQNIKYRENDYKKIKKSLY